MGGRISTGCGSCGGAGADWGIAGAGSGGVGGGVSSFAGLLPGSIVGGTGVGAGAGSRAGSNVGRGDGGWLQAASPIIKASGDDLVVISPTTREPQGRSTI